MEYKAKQYKIDYQYNPANARDSYERYLCCIESMKNDTYIVKSFSLCDAINSLLNYCRTSGRADIHLLSCEEK